MPCHWGGPHRTVGLALRLRPTVSKAHLACSVFPLFRRKAEIKLPTVDLTLRVRKHPHAEREGYHHLPLALTRDAVAAGVLGLVERGIGLADEVLGRKGRRVRGGEDAQANGDLGRPAVVPERLVG